MRRSIVSAVLLDQPALLLRYSAASRPVRGDESHRHSMSFHSAGVSSIPSWSFTFPPSLSTI